MCVCLCYVRVLCFISYVRIIHAPPCNAREGGRDLVGGVAGDLRVGQQVLQHQLQPRPTPGAPGPPRMTPPPPDTKAGRGSGARRGFGAPVTRGSNPHRCDLLHTPAPKTPLGGGGGLTRPRTGPQPGHGGGAGVVEAPAGHEPPPRRPQGPPRPGPAPQR